MNLFNISKNRPTHGARLERWLGAEKVARLSDSMKDWYGPPIALAGVPGNVWALKGGDFGGIIKAGQFMSSLDYGLSRLDKLAQSIGRNSRKQCNVGFSSLSDIINEATVNNKRREMFFNKVGTAGVAGRAATLWAVGNMPSAGAVGSAAPGGRACDDSTAGALPLIDNPSGTDTKHILTAQAAASTSQNTLLLYDRIFDVAKTMSSSAAESVTGVPTRYQSSTASDSDFAGGNFTFVEVLGALSNTTHNWTGEYRNQAGTDAQVFPSMTGINSNAINNLDHPASSWFMPLATGDFGVMDLNEIECSSAALTGTVDFAIGHPLVWIPCPVATSMSIIDGINTAFNLVRIFDDACLAFLEMPKPFTTATNYSGSITACSG
jgi:hypothetical protein